MYYIGLDVHKMTKTRPHLSRPRGVANIAVSPLPQDGALSDEKLRVMMPGMADVDYAAATPG